MTHRIGKVPTGHCPDCQRTIHLRKNGLIGSHRRLYPNGYTRGNHCTGIGKPPTPGNQ